MWGARGPGPGGPALNPPLTVVAENTRLVAENTRLVAENTHSSG